VPFPVATVPVQFQMLNVPVQDFRLLLANAMTLLPLPKSITELLLKVRAPIPAVLFVAPCSERPPVLNVPPPPGPDTPNVIVAESFIRSVHALLPASRSVPPEFTLMFEVPLTRPEAAELELLISSVLLLTEVVPVYVLLALKIVVPPAPDDTERL
jgi:hypothetical protein